VSIQLPALQRIHDQLTIANNHTLTEIELPALQTIGWEVEIVENEALETVRAPALAEQLYGRIFSIQSAALHEIELPALHSAGIVRIDSAGDLSVVELPALESAESLGVHSLTATHLAFPSLRRISSHLTFDDDPQLVSLEFPLLQEVGEPWSGPYDDDHDGIELANNPRLASVEMPSLKAVHDDFVVDHNRSLTSLDLSALTKVLDDLEIRDTALEELAFPLLAILGGPTGAANKPSPFGGLIVADNPALRSVTLPSLTVAFFDFRITNNPLLPTCDAQALAAALMPSAKNVVIEGNAGTCP
jgi:hypothetical protein